MERTGVVWGRGGRRQGWGSGRGVNGGWGARDSVKGAGVGEREVGGEVSVTWNHAITYIHIMPGVKREGLHVCTYDNTPPS